MQYSLRISLLLCAVMLAPAALLGQTPYTGSPAPVATEVSSPVVPTVTLLVPTNGASIPGEGISMFWSKAAGNFIDKYNFQLAMDSSFANPVYDADAFDTTIGFGTLATGTYWWRVRAHDAFDDWGAFSPAWYFVMGGLSGVRNLTEEGSGAPMAIEPNPFSGATSLRFSLPRSGRTTLTVTDAVGRTIAKPFDEYLEAGEHLVPIDASGWPLGVYLCRLVTPSGVLTRSIVAAP